ncbi:hypothetical protein PoB_001225800 [Plakobranchus ocellatus]|uniref:Uncharacterized protein n=1 Tax=Plakobranchus ocellatus TaxID=259542 RepID=A0AAV3YTQ8_9GAST|nr:hypothetical protein PoB_001225800 [Plakobranchus ocellatus]
MPSAKAHLWRREYVRTCDTGHDKDEASSCNLKRLAQFSPLHLSALDPSYKLFSPFLTCDHVRHRPEPHAPGPSCTMGWRERTAS